MIFRDLDHLAKISFSRVHSELNSSSLHHDHSEKVSFRQVHLEEISFHHLQVRMNFEIAKVLDSSSRDLNHHEKISCQHVQDTTTIHDTVFDFSISARTRTTRRNGVG
jgi:hypothetical protein